MRAFSFLTACYPAATDFLAYFNEFRSFRRPFQFVAGYSVSHGRHTEKDALFLMCFISQRCPMDFGVRKYAIVSADGVGKAVKPLKHAISAEVALLEWLHRLNSETRVEDVTSGGKCDYLVFEIPETERRPVTLERGPLRDSGYRCRRFRVVHEPR